MIEYVVRDYDTLDSQTGVANIVKQVQGMSLMHFGVEVQIASDEVP